MTKSKRMARQAKAKGVETPVIEAPPVEETTTPEVVVKESKVEKDDFGCKKGTAVAELNKCFTTVGKSVNDLAEESKCRTTANHCQWLLKQGHIIRVGRGLYALPGGTAPEAKSESESASEETNGEETPAPKKTRKAKTKKASADEREILGFAPAAV